MSPSSLHQNEPAIGSLEARRDSPLKSSLYASTCPDTLSLNRMMINPSTFSAAHSALVRDYTRQSDKPKKICFEVVDYGYGDTAEAAPAPSKKRRYERRNSKTPAMLLAMNAALNLDFMEDPEETERDFSTSSEDDAWDGGLEIAEELVKQLQNRRR
ncbi:hypothetical protein MPSEU_000649000 [Mayamaea pseudoterrestris]|nr:hypothetical protein MPSEU_000649000 [Mayamaea pseudoterrestris]